MLPKTTIAMQQKIRKKEKEKPRNKRKWETKESIIFEDLQRKTSSLLR